MKVKSLTTLLLICGMIFSTAALTADEAPAKSRKANTRNKSNMRRGGQKRFDPNMLIAFQVREELKAYNENKTDENYKKLEAAVKKASAEITEKIRAELKKQLENLDKNQAKTTEEFLQKAKNGELKFPASPNGKRPPRGPWGGKRGKRPAPNQD